LTWETGSDVFSFTVLQTGRKGEFEVFKYLIEIGNSEGNISLTRQCHSYLQGGLKNWQPGKCVSLSYCTVQKRLGENGDLSCETEIGK